MNAPDPGSSESKSTGSRLWRQPRRRWLLGIPLGAVLAFGLGLLAYGGAGAAMHATTNEAFCADACHEMQAFTKPEWQASSHYKNAHGVHAGCPDCHVPGPFVPKMVRKVRAIGEGWHHLLGTIDTQEKYNAQKLEMAEHVWAYMKASDSRECRSCHSVERMDMTAQSEKAQRAHGRMATSGKTCIDCHQGVAHEVPEEP